MKHSPFFLITGPSGAGKSTVLDELLQHPELCLTRFVTTTTRAPREGEKNGVDYWFVTREAFEKDIKDDLFFEWADVYGNYYGSHRNEMERLRKHGGPVVMVIDVQGAKTLMDAVPESVVLFIDAPKGQLMGRLQERTMTEEERRRRIATMEQEEAFRSQAHVVIENENGKLDQTIEQVIREIQQRTVGATS